MTSNKPSPTATETSKSSAPSSVKIFERWPESARVRLEIGEPPPDVLEMIDVAYDGSVFNVALADIPERKPDLVAGTYAVELPWERPYSPVAVKITDMLGEEVLVVLDR